MAPLTTYFKDEEDCLGFPIWVAELELIVGSARGSSRPDSIACLALLHKLVATLARAGREEVRAHQRRCEDAVLHVLLKGAPPSVRRLLCAVLSRLYAQGDTLPLYSRVSSLQLFLGTREAQGRETGDAIRLGALEALTALYADHGGLLSIGVQDTATRAASLAALAAEAEPRVRRAWAGLLGDLACAAGSTEAHAAVEALAPKPKARTALAAVLAAAPAACLAVPLAQAVAGGGRAQVGACLQAWGRYLGGAGGGDGQEREADEERACTLRVLRSAAIERLAEPGRRSLLRRLTALLVGGGGGEGSSGDGGTTQTEAPAPPAPSGLHLVPVAVVLLESVALVIELLGEAGAETLAALSPALLACLGWPAQGARVQAARALAALAVAEPGAAAGLLRGALTEARAARDALAAAGGAVRSEGPDCRLHGAALGCAALLAASTRLAMGLPGELAREVADLAHELALFPRCPAGPAQCCEREAAYIMLGALGTLARPDIMLWAPALDTQAADALVELMAGGGRQSQAQEAAAVAELTWRAAAAEALLPLLLREEDERQGPAPPANGRAPVPAGATFLAPTLGALCREPTLADPLRCRSARVAAAVALLQTRVLGALRRPADLPPSAQEALSTLCLRGLRSPLSLSVALMHAHLRTLGALLSSVSPANQGVLLDALLALAQEPVTAGLGAVVGTLCALATASPPPALQTALHALLACAEAAGPAFLPHVLPALELCRDALLRADLYDEPGLLPAAGRLVNAAVASLGPEYALGSRAHDLCKLVVAEAAAAAALGGGTGDDDCSESAVGGVGENSGGSGSMPSTLTTVAAPASPAAALVVVLHTQMLVLFAPGALPAAAHLAVLAGPMASRSAPLRSATLRTLRHLAERDAAAVLAWPGDLPAALVGALDAETRPELAAQAEATLGTLLRAGAAAAPSRWLALAGGVVLEGAEGQGAAGGLDDGRDGRGDGEKERDGDEDGVGAPDDRARREAARGDGHAPGPDAGVQAGPRPRLGTRLFLADCLAGLPLLAASADARHVDPVAAAGAAGRDWLEVGVEQLVHVGFVEATGQLEALRPPGVALLVVVVRVFAGVRDPLAEGGEPLLGQYEAQLVSAISGDAPPSRLAAALGEAAVALPAAPPASCTGQLAGSLPAAQDLEAALTAIAAAVLASTGGRGEAVRLVARLLCAEGAGQGSEQAQTVLLACLRAVHLHAEAGADPAVSAAAGAVLEALGSCGDPRRLLTAGLAGLRGGAALRRPAALAVARACGLLTTQQGSGSGTVGYSGPESGLPSVSELLDMAVGEVASGTEEVAGQGSDGDSAVALISALLSLGEAASALGAGTRCTEEAASAGALEDRSSPATARCLRALHALASSPAATAAVHQAVTDNLARPGAGRGWALRCGAAVLAPSLDAARAAMLAGPQGMRGASDALAGLRSAARLAVLTANAAAVAGRPDLQPALLGRLLPRGAEAGETPAAGRDEGEGTAAVPRPAIALKSFGGGGLARPPAFSRSAGVKASLGPADNSDEDGWGDD
ncbi:HEAT repeat-containing protein 5A [Auxenochlorella protothecoides]|uniref:HEAT repeat-containing protein 5A n=1 Tax=Auxenochlorella protothecoides TaxID=3075 RepID=A0A087SLP6_AUXPR|nr:HEAT repeat-containing protein 5A [Auxenochlorella protothecoides]KFM26650.1 HEAT repeat-containing protein 5A [Auxenochlorella protothecoides]